MGPIRFRLGVHGEDGGPNNPKIPHWPAYDASKRATLIFDSEVRVEEDPRGEIRKFWADMPPAAARRG